MKIVGIIAEYNPFHNGHLYQINKAKESTGADHVVIVMSGDYVQRGTPAIIPKHLRAQMALMAGASAVIELPVCYATGSAEYFASGAASILHSLGCIDSLCFGSECGYIETLKKIALVLLDEPESYRHALQLALRCGHSFPYARQLALKEYFKDISPDIISDQVLEKPNNILGIEYMKALLQMNSPIKPYTIQRIVSGYHDSALTETYSSASAIRNRLKEEDFSSLEGQMPEECIQILRESWKNSAPVYADDFSLLLKHCLLQNNAVELTQYADVSAELANRMIKNQNDFISFDQFCDILKTKETTYTRISRALLHILLGITESALNEYKSAGMCQYARILGFRKDKQEVLGHLKANASVPLITKITHTHGLSPVGQKMLEQDIKASNLYGSVVTDKFRTSFINEYQKQIIRIDG